MFDLPQVFFRYRALLEEHLDELAALVEAVPERAAAASYGDFYWRAAKAVAEDRPEPPLS